VLGKPVLPLVLLLDADSPYGFEDRQWRATTMTPGRHAAYAFQWLAMAIAAAGCWIALGRRRGAQ
jgi:cytochrome oxidase assembly protein ShyY1